MFTRSRRGKETVRNKRCKEVINDLLKDNLSELLKRKIGRNFKTYQIRYRKNVRLQKYNLVKGKSMLKMGLMDVYQRKHVDAQVHSKEPAHSSAWSKHEYNFTVFNICIYVYSSMSTIGII